MFGSRKPFPSIAEYRLGAAKGFVDDLFGKGRVFVGGEFLGFFEGVRERLLELVKGAEVPSVASFNHFLDAMVAWDSDRVGGLHGG